MEDKHINNTNYPFVFVHGMYGYGDSVWLSKLLPYWGMYTGSLVKYLNSQNFECYAPSVGPLSSAWDRACELYAQLFGGTVDYGVAHSKEHGHNRFGRTYEKPLVSDIGKRNADGSIKKINLIGHSFGGETIRMLSHLLEYGSKEERKATLPQDISSLFVGGKGKLIHSVTTIASPHNGITTLYANRSAIDISNYLAFFLGNIIGNTELNNFYDIHLEQFNLSGDSKESRSIGKAFNTVGVAEVVQSRDNIYYDLGIYGAKKMNQFLRVNPRAYYFSFATCSENELKKHLVSGYAKSALSVICSDAYDNFQKIALQKFTRIGVDEKWSATDGAANTYSSIAPLDEQSAHFSCPEKAQKGIWTVMDIVYVKHMEIVGKILKPKDKQKFLDFYVSHLNMINSLKD